MKKGQIVKILLDNGETVEEAIKHIQNGAFNTKNYSFKIDKFRFIPEQDGVKGCCLLHKTTLVHKLTLGIF